MSTIDNDGGPAFPVNYSNEADDPKVMPTPGMSLRDWFAGMAMQGMFSFNVPGSKETRAEAAYEMADAMIKARKS